MLGAKMRDNKILKSKIQPPKLLSTLVARDELCKKISETEEKVVVLNAGSGYGKTTLLSYFLEKNPYSVGSWYHLDLLDNDLLVFLEYFGESIRRVVPKFKYYVKEDIKEFRSNKMMINDFVLALADVKVECLNIVLDNYQEINNVDIEDLLSEIISNTDINIRLFVAVKGSLPEFFTRHILSGSVKILGNEDLAFSLEEIEYLLQKMAHYSIKEQDRMAYVSYIFTYTEGWPIGVISIFLRMKQLRNAITVKELQELCMDSYASKYLMYEVFRKLPYDLQQFCIQTSVLSVLNVDICNAVLGIYDAKSTLDYLVKENLFVTKLSGDNKDYRYHAVFKNYLQEQLTRESRFNIYKKAMFAFLDRGMKEQAIEYGILCNEYRYVEEWMLQLGFHLIGQKRYTTVLHWLEYLERYRDDWSIAMSIFVASIYVSVNNLQKGKDLFSSAVQKAEKINNIEEQIYISKLKISYYGILADFMMAEEEIINCMSILSERKSKTYLPVWYQVMEQLMEVKLILRKEKEAYEVAETICNMNVGGLEGKILRRVSYIRSQALLLMEILTVPIKKEFSEYENWVGISEERYDRVLTNTIAEFWNWKYTEKLYHDKDTKELKIEMAKYFEHVHDVQTYSIYTRYLFQCIGGVEDRKDREEIERYLEYNRLPYPGGIKEWKLESQENKKIVVNCFGEFKVCVQDEDEPVKWRTKKAKELFALLFDKGGTPVSKDILIDVLWKDMQAKSSSTLFYTTLSYVKKTLSDKGFDNVICGKQKMYFLDMSQICSHKEDMQSLIAGKESEDSEVSVDCIYQGAYMQGISGDWVIEQREYYERMFLKICKEQSNSYIRKEQYEKAANLLTRAIVVDEYSEEFAARLIQCYGLIGDVKNAKKQFERIKKRLQEELGVEPGEELIQTYRKAVENR